MDCKAIIFVLIASIFILLVEVARPTTFQRERLSWFVQLGERLAYVFVGVAVMWILIHNHRYNDVSVATEIIVKTLVGISMFLIAFAADMNIGITTTTAHATRQFGQRFGYAGLSAWALVLFGG